MNKLDLVWTRYDKPPVSKFQLIVFLGQEGPYNLALLADAIPDEEVQQFREKIEIIRAMGIPATKQWIKTFMPISYAKGYRRYETTLLVELRIYGITAV